MGKVIFLTMGIGGSQVDLGQPSHGALLVCRIRCPHLGNIMLSMTMSHLKVVKYPMYPPCSSPYRMGGPGSHIKWKKPRVLYAGLVLYTCIL